MTDDPRNILRESRTVARVAESAATQVSAARRTATTRDADEQNADGRATDATFDSESETQQPDSAPRSPTSAPRPGGVFQAIMDTRSYLENRRDAMSILEAPALGLARPSLDDERTIARVLPDGPDLSCEWRLGDADVVVVVGCTPPPAKYFGLTSYVYRSYEAGVVRTIFGSLGDTLSVGGDGVGNDGNAKFTYVLGLSQITTLCHAHTCEVYHMHHKCTVRPESYDCLARLLRLLAHTSYESYEPTLADSPTYPFSLHSQAFVHVRGFRASERRRLAGGFEKRPGVEHHLCHRAWEVAHRGAKRD